MSLEFLNVIHSPTIGIWLRSSSLSLLIISITLALAGASSGERWQIQFLSRFDFLHEHFSFRFAVFVLGILVQPRGEIVQFTG